MMWPRLRSLVMERSAVSVVPAAWRSPLIPWAAGALMVENAGGEFYALPAPHSKLRMCASNGKLREKLQIGSLLK